jgi:beta-aspartyl-peptidase (threonine type)
MTVDNEQAYLEALATALEAGHTILRAGGTALDAITASVIAMENNPLFNAGRGATFSLDGTVALDAAVMDGATQNAGTVAGVSVAKNPILLARCVMESTPNVMLGFAGADALARSRGLECVDQDYYFTQRRWDALRQEKARIASGGSAAEATEAVKHGTIGAVALDDQGRLAAATSTGGRTAKWVGRIGDTPIIGAGTWADGTCAVSCTGDGEYFIRIAAAHDVAARMAYQGQTVREASHGVIHKVLASMGATGGMIVVDASGQVAMPFNSEGMYRAMVDGQGKRQIAIFQEDSEFAPNLGS